MQGSDKYASFKAPEQAVWWKSAVERLEKEVGIKKAERIMNLCGQKCCGKGIRKTAKRLMDESNSIEEFLKRASTDGLKEGEVEYKLKDQNTIIGTFNRCFCGQVAQTKAPFKNKTYCQCSAEFHKQYFEAALGKPVEVEITRSIISGAESCEFLIQINR
jgi:predicted hydrocarbon binding protein